MRRITYLVAALLGLALLPLTVAGSAQADGCPSDQSVLDYSKNDPPYQCAVHYWSGKKSLAPLDSKSWSADTALGYNVESKCGYRSSSEVTWTWVGAGPSYSATFSNFATTTRHFGTGVIFTTGSVNGDQIKSDSNCANGDGKIQNSIKRITKGITLDQVKGNGGNSGSTVTFSGTVSPSSTTGFAVLVIAGEPVTSNDQPVAGPIVDGKYTIAWKTPIIPTDVILPVSVVFPGDTSQCPAAAKSCGATPAGPTEPVMIRLKKSYTPMSSPQGSVSSSRHLTTSGEQLIEPVASAETGSDATVSADSNPSLVVREKSVRMPGKLGIRCPAGSVLLHAESNAASSSRTLAYGSRGVQFKRGVIPKGRMATVQVTCRHDAKSPLTKGRAGFGTAKADRMSTGARRGVVFGGPGADRLVVNRKGGIAQGGLGHDRIVVRAASGVAAGGPGNDVIRVKAAKRTLVIGGPGRDRIVAGGKARVNAKDGARDVVVCKGSKVRVMADRQDRLVGPCQRI